MSRFVPTLVALSTLSLIVLTGCGAGTSFSGPSPSARVAGKVFGGQQPVANSTVTVWRAGVQGYGSDARALVHTTTLADGTFSFADQAYPCAAGEQVYITASGGESSPDNPNPGIMLAVGLGDCTAAQSEVVEINEVTTAATAFALAQFFTPVLGSTSNDAFGTAGADLPAFTLSNQFTIPTLVDLPTGTVKPNTPGMTIEAAKIYTIANILAACVNDGADFAECDSLFINTTAPARGSVTPTDTLQAAVQMARFPYNKVTALYKLASAKPPFVGLATQPNDWTIGVSYTSSSYALGISGSSTSGTSASIDIDASGKVWFPTNLSRSTGVAYFDPASATFNGPYITETLVQPQYVAIDANGYIWATDPLSNLLAYQDTANPGGTGSSGSLAFDQSSRLGAIAGRSYGDVFFSVYDGFGRTFSYYEDLFAIHQYEGEFSNQATGLVAGNTFVTAFTSGSSTPCSLEVNPYNEGRNVLLATGSNCTSGGMAFGSGGLDTIGVATSLNELCSFALNCSNPFPGNFNLPEGIATDGYGNEWIANSGNGSVFTFGAFMGSGGYSATSPVMYLHDTNHGGTMTSPYGIAIDGSGNVWIGNASCVTTSDTACAPGPFVLSELIGAAAPTIAPLSLQMVNDGALVGSPPGTPSPNPNVSRQTQASHTF